MEDSHSVAIFWDYENCPPGSNSTGYEVANAIRNIAHKYGTLKHFKAYFDLAEQSSPKSTKLRSELQSSGVSLTDCPHNSGKDVADKMILVDMMAFAFDNPAPATAVLISCGGDFAYAVSVLRHRRYRVILVAPTTAHASLKAQASAVLDWNRDVLEKCVFGGFDLGFSLPLFSHGEKNVKKSSSIPQPSAPKPTLRRLSCDARIRGGSFSETRGSTIPVDVGGPRAPWPRPGSGRSESPAPNRAMDCSSKTLDHPLFVHKADIPDRGTPSFKPGFETGSADGWKQTHSGISGLHSASATKATNAPIQRRISLERRTSRKDSTVSSLTSNNSFSFSSSSHPINMDGVEPPNLITKRSHILSSTVVPTPIFPKRRATFTDSLATVAVTSCILPADTISKDNLLPQNTPLPPSPSSSPRSEQIEDKETHTAMAAPNADSTPDFRPLVEQLLRLRSAGNSKPLRSIVGQVLVTHNQYIYHQLGVSGFSQYVALAQQSEIVELGGTGGKAWISLRMYAP